MTRTMHTPLSATLDGADRQAMATIRCFLEDVAYRSVWQQQFPAVQRLSFPAFDELQHAIARFSPSYQLLFRLLCAGETIPIADVRPRLQPRVLEALLECGLLVGAEHGSVRTPGLAVLSTPLGLHLAVSLPPSYPTASGLEQAVYIGPDSMWMVSALPASLRGARVLDVCSGSGIQGLVCASRGAAAVVALERHPAAVAAARFNAALNSLDEGYDVRRSDVYDALRPGERFDVVVSNPPFMPAVQGVGFPIFADGGADGTALLQRLVTELPMWMVRNGEAVFVAVLLGGNGSVNFTRDVLAGCSREHGWKVRTWVFGKVSCSEYLNGTLRDWIRESHPELEPADCDARTTAWREALAHDAIPAQYVYAQTTRITGPEWTPH